MSCLKFIHYISHAALDLCSAIVDTSHLNVLMRAMKTVVSQWRELGIQLGLNYHSVLEVIEKDRRKAVDCMIDMLAEWLKGAEGECNKQTLKAALQEIDCKISE